MFIDQVDEVSRVLVENTQLSEMDLTFDDYCGRE